MNCFWIHVVEMWPVEFPLPWQVTRSLHVHSVLRCNYHGDWKADVQLGALRGPCYPLLLCSFLHHSDFFLPAGHLFKKHPHCLQLKAPPRQQDMATTWRTCHRVTSFFCKSTAVFLLSRITLYVFWELTLLGVEATIRSIDYFISTLFLVLSEETLEVDSNESRGENIRKGISFQKKKVFIDVS